MTVVDVDVLTIHNHSCADSRCWHFEGVLHVCRQQIVTLMKLNPLVCLEIKLPKIVGFVTVDVTTEEVEAVRSLAVEVSMIVSAGTALDLWNRMNGPLQ